MTCCLTASSHYLNQCWLIIKGQGVLWHSPESNFTGNAQDINSWNKFKITILKLFPHFPGANELKQFSMLRVNNSNNRHKELIQIDQSHKSHNAPVPYPTIHHWNINMHISVPKWCIVGYGTGALCDLWDWYHLCTFHETIGHVTLVAINGPTILLA